VTSVVFLTPEPISARVAGPAIRVLELGRVLRSEGLDARVVSTAAVDGTVVDLPVRHVDPDEVVAALAGVDVVVVGGDTLHRYPRLARGSARIVVDLYDPYQLEALERTIDLPPRHRELAVAAAVRSLRTSTLLGDWFMCASDGQRDLWLGQLAALGRVNPATYDADPTLRSLLGVVPFGTPPTPPAGPGGALRQALPTLKDTDEVLWWGGGLYNWFDPELLVRAVARLAVTRPALQLVFAGGAHPNPDVASGRAERAARATAAELGVLGTHVHFLPEWIEYERRGDYLADATLGVCTHLDHVETQFSFRTRLLDHLWAGLPTLSTSGDALSGVIAANGAGWTVPPGDLDALVDVLDQTLSDPAALVAAGARARELSRALSWSNVAGPLVQYCSTPAPAPDLIGRRRRSQVTLARSLNAFEGAREIGAAAGRRARQALPWGRTTLTTATRRKADDVGLHPGP
jgi:glycosyltransferase involved in cell wall biosynthesis